MERGKVSSLSNVLPRGNPGFWWKSPCEGKNNKERTGRPKKSGKESRLGKARVRRVYIFFPICKKTRGSVEKGRRERMERGRAPGGSILLLSGGRESAGSPGSPPGSSSSRRCFPQQPFFSRLQVGLSPYFLFYARFCSFPSLSDFQPGCCRVWGGFVGLSSSLDSQYFCISFSWRFLRWHFPFSLRRSRAWPRGGDMRPSIALLVHRLASPSHSIGSDLRLFVRSRRFLGF